MSAFTDMECLNSTFESSVSHKGMPFGLTETTVKVKKENCLIIVEHNELKYIYNKWEIDVCREPIHIKESSGAIEVLKKTGNCNSPQKNEEFCKAASKIEAVLQDDGLIFADGEKENLNSDHGRLYCTFLILKSYLRKDVIYSRHRNYEDTLFNSDLKTKETCPVPEKKEVEATEVSPSAVPTEPVPAVNVQPQAPVDNGNGSIPDTNEQGRF